MSRKWEHDGDDARIAPNGSVRCGYDADTQTYTYRHPNGDYYEGDPGSEYGPLRLVSQRRQNTSAMTPRSAQPPAYSSSNSSPPPYSPPTRGPQANRPPPAVTFDEILTRHPTDNNKPVSRPVDREQQQSAAVAHMGPRRAVSLRSIFGFRARFSSAAERSQQLPHKALGRSATTRETYSTYGSR
ncbi:hypothetical protein CONLIGDRAFT_237671 [Coniochaeta ligniaria NRRL 30616]|uniref:Uncharacterized protein n=1 Tax=Coniochaeta ligniaria NRRL 30616 TaxID=1408157 RepID=A0A1J7IX13_9PEZI|nr:hypothetical protein CONLIGDRAFT_237671 [Coniochaeta ligniaria NRRL 30616]